MLTVKFDINGDEFVHLEIVNKGEISEGKFKYDYILDLITLHREVIKYEGTVQYEREEGALLLAMICFRDWKKRYLKQSLYDTFERDSIIEREIKYPADKQIGVTICKATT